MLVGDDEALPRDDDAGAERRLLALAALAIAEAVAEEAAEEGIVEQRRDGPLLDLALGEDVHQRRRRLLHHRREGQHRLATAGRDLADGVLRGGRSGSADGEGKQQAERRQGCAVVRDARDRESTRTKAR